MELRDRRVTTEDMAARGERRRPILNNAEERSLAAEEKTSEAQRAEELRANEARRNEDARAKEMRRAEEAAPGTPRHDSHPTNGDDKLSPLLAGNEGNEMRSRWNNIQAGFVDEPRRAVEQADELVAETMQRLAQSFAEQKRNLETQWEHSDQVSTEDLRMAFRRYRSFFDRLLSL